jgi:LmbE family N-acetylglucosaminyl deacetylase
VGVSRVVEAERASRTGDVAATSPSDGLAAVWGPDRPSDRAPRIIGLFSHPDDEVFCVGGTIARCAEAGAVTGIACLTQGEAGQIRDVATATRRTLGAVRVKELQDSASALGVDHVTCLDLGDGQLSARPLTELAAIVRTLIEGFAPDVVVTFGPDGGFGHPDHVASCRAAAAAVPTMDRPPRLLHAKFPMRGALMVELIVEWLTSLPQRFRGSAEFGHALKLFADGTSMLGVAADHVRVEWYPPGSFIIEQDEPATELHCILSGTADIVVEHDDGSLRCRDTVQRGCFVGEDGLLTRDTHDAHVIARDEVTCLVLSPEQPDRCAARGERASRAFRAASAVLGTPVLAPSASGGVEDCLMVDVRPALDRKVAALAAHRSQYALRPDLLPPSMLERLLGTERYVVAGTGR